MQQESTDEPTIGEVTDRDAQAFKHALMINAEEKPTICILADETDEETQRIISEAKRILGEDHVEVLPTSEYETAKKIGHKTIILVANHHGDLCIGRPNFPTDEEIETLKKRLDDKIYIKPYPEMVYAETFKEQQGTKDKAKPFDFRVKKKKGGLSWR